MGFRARRTISIMPGVRMTVTPRGVSASAGVRGARVTAHTSGRLTRTVGIPGSGLSYVSTTNLKRPASASRMPAAQRVAPPAAKPSAFAPRWEKQMFDAAVRRRDANAVRQVAIDFSEARPVGALLETVLGAIPSGDVNAVRLNLTWLLSTDFDPTTNPFMTKYLGGATLMLEVAAGIVVELPLTLDAIKLALAEAHQAAGDVAAAVKVAEDVTPSTVSALSLAELYIAQERWGDVVELTNGLTNVDEAAVFLLVQRAIALRESGTPGAAREALKEALRLRSRPAGLRHLALIERAYTYLAEGKPAMARKDLEKVLADDANYPGLQAALAKLPSA